MKYIKAFLYAILMTFVFFSTVIFVEGVSSAQQMIKILNNAIKNDNYHILLRGEYQSLNPLFEKSLSTIDFNLTIIGYETVSIKEDSLINYLEIIIISTEGEMSAFSDFEPSLRTNDEDYLLWLLKYLNLEVYTVLADNKDNSLPNVTNIFEKGDAIDSFILGYTPSNEDELKEFSVELNLNINDFTLIDSLANYKNINNTYPTENTDTILLQQNINVDSKVPVIITGITLIILISLLTYYIYSIRPKRKLGKQQISQNLEKDLKRIENSNQE